MSDRLDVVVIYLEVFWLTSMLEMHYTHKPSYILYIAYAIMVNEIFYIFGNHLHRIQWILQDYIQTYQECVGRQNIFLFVWVLIW